MRFTGPIAALIAGALAVSACADDSYVINPIDAASVSPNPGDDPLVAAGNAHLTTAACTRGPMTCPGTTWPDFKAPNFQPASTLHGQSHGLEIYKGRIIIVAMLAAW